jgi:hypothetical protein
VVGEVPGFFYATLIEFFGESLDLDGESRVVNDALRHGVRNFLATPHLPTGEGALWLVWCLVAHERSPIQ